MEWKDVILNIFWMFVVLFVNMTNPIYHSNISKSAELGFFF